jgi:hypothetical protein
MLAQLRKKTAQLKWLKTLKTEQTARCPVANVAAPCDCRAWLTRQANKRTSIKKPPARVAKTTPLLLVAPAAPKQQRNAEYNRRFEQGEAAWYHIPAAALQDYHDAQIQSIRYVALGITRPGIADRVATHLYAVGSVALLPRHMLTVEQSGSLKASDTPYWLFSLTESVALAQPIRDFSPTFMAKIAVADQLLTTHSFTALAEFKDASHD